MIKMTMILFLALGVGFSTQALSQERGYLQVESYQLLYGTNNTSEEIYPTESYVITEGNNLTVSLEGHTDAVFTVLGGVTNLDTEDLYVRQYDCVTGHQIRLIKAKVGTNRAIAIKFPEFVLLMYIKTEVKQPINLNLQQGGK